MLVTSKGLSAPFGGTDLLLESLDLIVDAHMARLQRVEFCSCLFPLNDRLLHVA